MSFEEKIKQLENNLNLRFQNVALSINDYANAVNNIVGAYKMENARLKDLVEKVNRDAKHNTE